MTKRKTFQLYSEHSNDSSIIKIHSGSEDDYSRREWAAKGEYWDNCFLEDKIRLCKRARVSIFSARKKEIPRDVDQFIEVE
ncbi:MAG: hypothetical protein PHV97_00670 [Candidatus Omnitrophica bacterium]|nr:hypothetical protein [Candidatus Omnitrophota bacterium]